MDPSIQPRIYMGKVHISPGNSKLGAYIPNISLLPVETCSPGVPCAAPGGCYAMRYRNWPTTWPNWTENTQLVRYERPFFFESIHLYLQLRTPRFFRWHVAGDILDQDYLDRMCTLAANIPNTLFLAFTKRYELDYSGTPANLQIVYSAWPGLVLPALPPNSRVAWMQDGTETRIPPDALECPGACEACGMCFTLSQVGHDVYFHKH